MTKLFEGIQLRDLSLKNRIMVSPMCQYQSDDTAEVKAWHEVHYGSLALGGAGLVMVEATAVEARGRITERDLGLYRPEHMDGLRKIVTFAHQQGAAMAVQLGHAGRKAAVSQDIVAPSSLRFSRHYKQPLEATPSQLQEIVEAFRQAAARAVEVGFDFIELHGAHGYLLNQFLSPISNQRKDEWGESRENRLRFPLAVVKAVRSAMPDSMPLCIRVSATEFSPEGYSMDDMIYYCRQFKAAGVDIIDVSGGGNTTAAPCVYPGYQVQYAESIREGVGIPVIAVGLLDDARLAESVLQDNRADMIAIARGFLRNKHWALQAARDLNEPVLSPEPYKRAW